MICTYREYFSLPETHPFSGSYEAVLEPYRIDPMNAAATQTPASVSQKIYSASQQEDPTSFLLWYTKLGITKDQDPGRISLLHSVSYYASRTGRPPCKWDDGIFANRGYVSYGTAPLAVWDPTYLHLAPAVYVPSAAAIDTSSPATQTSCCWDLTERETRGLKSYAVARQCMSPRLMSVYCCVLT